MEAPKRDGEMNESAEALKRDEERGDCPEATSEPTFEPQNHKAEQACPHPATLYILPVLQCV